MGIQEQKKEVRTYNVYAKCDKSNCAGTFIENNPFIIWDNNGTPGDLTDDTFNYSYICDTCSETVISHVKYPHQEFVEI
jgi:hypothetical protein